MIAKRIAFFFDGFVPRRATHSKFTVTFTAGTGGVGQRSQTNIGTAVNIGFVSYASWLRSRGTVCDHFAIISVPALLCGTRFIIGHAMFQDRVSNQVG
jgi:hypothetical protein